MPVRAPWFNPKVLVIHRFILQAGFPLAILNVFSVRSHFCCMDVGEVLSAEVKVLLGNGEIDGRGGEEGGEDRSCWCFKIKPYL